MEYHQSQYREQEKIRQLNRMRHHMPTKIYENEYYQVNNQRFNMFWGLTVYQKETIISFMSFIR